MLLECFEKNIKKLGTWFDRKLNHDQLDILYQETKNIPDSAFDEITKRMIETQRRFPTIQDIKLASIDWKKRNLNKMTMEQIRTDCEQCHGRGFLWFQRVEATIGSTSEYCCRCGDCQNWFGQINTKIMPAYTRHALETQGFHVWPYDS
ncbi:MAG: hypothetical protein JSW07_05365 [bacterium]|nr:MAG: hypothetical protein JSW07_05365 [bacterium]